MRQHRQDRCAKDASASRAGCAAQRAISALAALASALILGACVAACMVALPAPASASEVCENEARRLEQGSTYLPDCRAYELVTLPYQPAPFHLQDFLGHPPSPFTELTYEATSALEPQYMPQTQPLVSIARDGDAALFGTFNESNGESDSLSANLSLRGPDGWTGENIIPPRSRHTFLCDAAGYTGFSANLEQVAIDIGFGEGNGSLVTAEACGHAEPPVAPGESTESANLLLRDTASRSFKLINVTPPGVSSYDPHFVAISADGSHVAFVSRAQLAPDAPNGEVRDRSYTEGHCTSPLGNLYIWSAGEVHLLTVLPDGTPVRGLLAGTQPELCGAYGVRNATFTHSISADGERALFYSGGGFQVSENGGVLPTAPYIDGGLYLRERPGAAQSALNTSGECDEPAKACTIQLDLPQGVAGPGGGGQFRWASADLSKVFFTDERKLTPDSNAAPGKPDLYEYDLDKPAGQRLTDLTPDASEPADVLGIGGVSEDGSYVYFVAHGVLGENQQNARHATPVAGQANLYVRHGGATTFIVTLDEEGGDRCDWTTICLTSRVSQNGRFIAFDSIDSLTGYDNHPQRTEACQRLTQLAGSPCIEAYRYDAESGALTCATCNPSGAPPASEWAWSVVAQPAREGFPLDGSMAVTNAVSDAGQVFFETMEKLLGADENETWDVYEYGGGEGSSAQLHLISSGKSELPSYFVDATPDGSNVFFVTFQSLLHADTRTDYDLYDARVGGGFVSQSEAIQPPACEALEACRAPVSEPPAQFSAGSAALSGAGNLVPTPKQPLSPGKAPAKRKAHGHRLAQALKVCARRYRHAAGRRRACVRRARKRYRPKARNRTGAGK